MLSGGERSEASPRALPLGVRGVRSLDVGAVGWWRRALATRRVRVAVWMAVAVLLGFGAYHVVYTAFPIYDDTGDWSIGVWSFMHHGSLYASTYGITGPFYYEFWTAVLAVTGLGVNPDIAALTSLVCWIAAAVLVGVAVRALTRSMLLALLATLTVFILLEVNAQEALEPAHISYVFAGALLVGVCAWPRLGDRARLRAAVGGGVICAATFLTKVNIGALLTCGVLFGVAIYWPGRRARLVLRPLACVALMLVPVALMWTGIHGTYYFYYKGLFWLMEISLLGLAALALTTEVESEPLTRREAWAGLAAFVVTVAVVWLIVIADGTPVARVVTKGIFGEANLIKWNGILPPFPSWALLLAKVSTGVAIVVAALSGRWTPGWGRRLLEAVLTSWPSALLRLLVGFWILLTCIPYWHYNVNQPIGFASFAVAVPVSWVAMVGRGAGEGVELRFVRTLIGVIGCLGCLEVYPVAGSQEGWASVLLVPVALVCIWDGFELLRARSGWGRRLFLGVGWAGVLAAGAFLVSQQAWLAARDGYDAYTAGVSPDVPGGGQFRLSPVLASAIRGTTRTVDRRCARFVTSPGMYSFYFFTRQPPPTGLNVNQWREELSDAQQRRVLGVIRGIPRLCVIANPALNLFWYPKGASVPHSALFDYTRRDFVPVATYDPYTVKVRRPVVGRPH